MLAVLSTCNAKHLEKLFFRNIMSDQQFCLKWNNYAVSVTSVFRELLAEEQMCDVTLSTQVGNIVTTVLLVYINTLRHNFCFNLISPKL